ncbi:MAG: hypothetical protein ACTSVW_00890, partial [Candidatus Njordarchaeales archaeon]
YMEVWHVGVHYIYFTVTKPPSNGTLGYVGWGSDTFKVTSQTIGAFVNVKQETPEEKSTANIEIRSPGTDIEVITEEEKVTLKVSSTASEGKTIVVTIDKYTLDISSPDQIQVFYDGEEINMADDYNDVLILDEDVPEYCVCIGAKGIQILISIPHFSTHTIEVVKLLNLKISINGLPPSCKTKIYLDGNYLNEIAGNQTITFKIQKGTNHTFSVERTIVMSPDIRYVCSYDAVNIFSQEKVSFNYTKQYYLKLISSYGNPRGEGWYDANSNATINIEKSVAMKGLLGLLGAKKTFSHWSGDFTSSDPTAVIAMNEPKQIEAIWVDDYSIIYIEFIALVSAICIILFYQWRTKKD